ncbi:hypothetical protein BD310DRAFT_458954 [Dichomitus squalens]|uniref:Uncharacterized protein n=1 Tax=Dichomitus squalens TaxID=114155 RepID=A0A4Q9QA45_9APHY|nr:hypothetical protein BD310DRAFT_458954 [Dichomitus squalens]
MTRVAYLRPLPPRAGWHRVWSSPSQHDHFVVSMRHRAPSGRRPWEECVPCQGPGRTEHHRRKLISGRVTRCFFSLRSFQGAQGLPSRSRL